MPNDDQDVFLVPGNRCLQILEQDLLTSVSFDSNGCTFPTVSPKKHEINETCTSPYIALAGEIMVLRDLNVVAQ